jgi:hypothetical protein
MPIQMSYSTDNDEYPDAFWRVERVDFVIATDNSISATVSVAAYKSKAKFKNGGTPLLGSQRMIRLSAQEVNAMLSGRLNLRAAVCAALLTHVPNSSGNPIAMPGEIDLRTAVLAAEGE